MKLVSDVRTRFLSQHVDKYDSRDVDRVRESDSWLRHFLMHQKYNPENALKMMDTTIHWRNEFGVNDIKEETIPLRFWHLGAVYFHNKNVNGNDIMYFSIKLNKKGDAEYMKYARMMIAYLMDTYQRKNPLRRLVALLDMTGVGLMNVDISLTKFLVTCFTTYFPGMLECLLVYDMPWIVNGVWSVVKLMLSEDEQKHVIFCKKSSVQQYIDKSQLFPHMGGTDTYIYTYEPHSLDDGDDDDAAFQEAEDDHFGGDAVDHVASLPDIAQNVPGANHDRVAKKQVNWAAKDDVQEFSPPTPSPPVERATPLTGNDVTPKVSRSDSAESASDGSTKASAYKISIVPTSELQFTRPGINQEASCTLKLTNNQTVSLAFKVKTTDPKNYRVKQARGILSPQQSDTVQITLLPGKEIKRDKFLVLSTKLSSGEQTQSELSAYWKSLSKSQIHEHKLRCHEAALDLDSSVNPAGSLSNSSSLSNAGGSAFSSIRSRSFSQDSLVTTFDGRLEKVQGELGQVKLLLKITLGLVVLLIGILLAK